MVLPHEFAVLLAAVVELPNEFEGFSAFDALAVWQIVHKFALVDHVAFFVGALAVGCVVLELALVAIAVSADVTSNSSHFILYGRCLKKRLILEDELAFPVDAAFFPLAPVEDAVAEVEDSIQICAGWYIGGWEREVSELFGSFCDCEWQLGRVVDCLCEVGSGFVTHSDRRNLSNLNGVRIMRQGLLC